MFSPHVPDEIIELLVAKVFCHPGGLSPPNSREVAFARFLELLCTHPFGILPVVLDPESSGGQTGEDCAISRDAIKRAEDLLLPSAMKDDVEEEEEKTATAYKLLNTVGQAASVEMYFTIFGVLLKVIFLTQHPNSEEILTLEQHHHHVDHMGDHKVVAICPVTHRCLSRQNTGETVHAQEHDGPM